MINGRRWWAKKEDLVDNDTSFQVLPLPATDFKASHIYKKPKEETFDKAATKDFTKPSSYIGKKAIGNKHMRWTEVELKYSKVKGRLFDNLP